MPHSPSLGGTLLAVNPLAFLICLGSLILLVLVVRDSARANFIAGILAAPALWLLQVRDVSFYVALAGGLVITFRFLIDWNRKDRELWLDRENTGRGAGWENVHLTKTVCRVRVKQCSSKKQDAHTGVFILRQAAI